MTRLTKCQSRSALTILVNPTLTGIILPLTNILGGVVRTCPVYDTIFDWKLLGRFLFTTANDDVNLTWRNKDLLMLGNRSTL